MTLKYQILKFFILQSSFFVTSFSQPRPSQTLSWIPIFSKRFCNQLSGRVKAAILVFEKKVGFQESFFCSLPNFECYSHTGLNFLFFSAHTQPKRCWVNTVSLFWAKGLTHVHKFNYLHSLNQKPSALLTCSPAHCFLLWLTVLVCWFF